MTERQRPADRTPTGLGQTGQGQARPRDPMFRGQPAPAGRGYAPGGSPAGFPAGREAAAGTSAQRSNARQGSVFQGSSSQGVSFQGAASRDAAFQGASFEGAASRGVPSQGGYPRTPSSQGAAPRGFVREEAARQGSYRQGSFQQGAFRQNSFRQDSFRQQFFQQGSFTKGSSPQGSFQQPPGRQDSCAQADRPGCAPLGNGSGHSPEYGPGGQDSGRPGSLGIAPGIASEEGAGSTETRGTQAHPTGEERTDPGDFTFVRAPLGGDAAQADRDTEGGTTRGWTDRNPYPERAFGQGAESAAGPDSGSDCGSDFPNFNSDFGSKPDPDPVPGTGTHAEHGGAPQAHADSADTDRERSAEQDTEEPVELDTFADPADEGPVASERPEKRPRGRVLAVCALGLALAAGGAWYVTDGGLFGLGTLLGTDRVARNGADAPRRAATAAKAGQANGAGKTDRAGKQAAPERMANAPGATAVSDADARDQRGKAVPVAQADPIAPGTTRDRENAAAPIGETSLPGTGTSAPEADAQGTLQADAQVLAPIAGYHPATAYSGTLGEVVRLQAGSQMAKADLALKEVQVRLAELDRRMQAARAAERNPEGPLPAAPEREESARASALEARLDRLVPHWKVRRPRTLRGRPTPWACSSCGVRAPSSRRVSPTPEAPTRCALGTTCTASAWKRSRGALCKWAAATFPGASRARPVRGHPQTSRATAAREGDRGRGVVGLSCKANSTCLTFYLFYRLLPAMNQIHT